MKSPRQIIELVSKATGVPVKAILDENRSERVVFARFMVVELLVSQGRRQADIAEVLDRTRATIRNAVERSYQMLKENPAYLETFKLLKDSI